MHNQQCCDVVCGACWTNKQKCVTHLCGEVRARMIERSFHYSHVILKSHECIHRPHTMGASAMPHTYAYDSHTRLNKQTCTCECVCVCVHVRVDRKKYCASHGLIIIVKLRLLHWSAICKTEITDWTYNIQRICVWCACAFHWSHNRKKCYFTVLRTL